MGAVVLAPMLIPLLLLCLDMFALGVLVTLWAVFNVGWMGGGETS